MGARLYEANDVEIGYRLQRVFWGKGYATEVGKALIRKGFLELGVKRIVASALSENQASIRVMEKIGLKFERKFIYTESQQEGVKYGLNKNQFELDYTKY